MQDRTPKTPNMATKINPMKQIHQGSFLGIGRHNLKIWKRPCMHTCRHDFWTKMAWQTTSTHQSRPTKALMTHILEGSQAKIHSNHNKYAKHDQVDNQQILSMEKQC